MPPKRYFAEQTELVSNYEAAHFGIEEIAKKYPYLEGTPKILDDEQVYSSKINSLPIKK